MRSITHSQLLQVAGYPLQGVSRSAVYRHLEIDSRKVDIDSVFFALPGVGSNGWDYLDKVSSLGCSVAVVPKKLNLKHDTLELVQVDDPATVLVSCLHGFFGHMPQHLVAVTGTNGKSSICYYLAQLANFIGLRSGLIGTFGIGTLDNLQEASQTTPDILSLHKTLIAMADDGVGFVAFEASSHALDQGRIDGVPFQTAVFSNLSRDHLDYHGDMQSYAAAKQKLFLFPTVKQSVFCLDDVYSKFMSEVSSNAKQYFYSEQNLEADFYVKNLVFKSVGCELVLCHPEGERALFLPLLGRFNIQNALAALASLWNVLEDKNTLLDGVSYLQGAPGRMDKVQVSNAPTVVVDYAHTPDALCVALQALREHASGKLICVFGCGGDRDRGKRPLMLEAAISNADKVWLTSDNPRTESPEEIVTDVIAQAKQSWAFEVEIDRRTAIEKAILFAGKDDVVLIAGKGHETYQDIQGVKHHFDDKEEAQKVLKTYVG